ncbi:MAG: hypothetical protein AB1403_24450, partial [Candidatus Riflebacteria bacterium]
PGMIFITEATKQKIEGKVSCTDLGLKKVKGKDEPIHVYTIGGESQALQKMAELAAGLMQQAGLKKSEAETVEPGPETAKLSTPAQPNRAKEALPDLASLESLSDSPAPPPAPDINTSQTKTEAEAIRDPVLEMICAIDSARQNYILAVRNGSKRQAELEEWFARYEEFIKPKLDL